MINVKSLVKRVNPVQDESTATAADGMSARAYDELVGLVGAEAADRQAGQGRGVRSRRPSRRGVLVAAIACTAAVVVAGVAVLGLQDPKEPGGGGGGDSGGSGLADEPYYTTTAELEAASVLIVRARLGAGHEETVDGLTETVATAEVVATAKGGSPAGSEIELAYTTPGSGPETADLAAGKEYVLLLDELDGGRFALINTTQGVYGIEGGQAVAGGDNDVILSPGVLKALRLTS